MMELNPGTADGTFLPEKKLLFLPQNKENKLTAYFVKGDYGG